MEALFSREKWVFSRILAGAQGETPQKPQKSQKTAVFDEKSMFFSIFQKKSKFSEKNPKFLEVKKIFRYNFAWLYCHCNVFQSEGVLDAPLEEFVPVMFSAPEPKSDPSPGKLNLIPIQLCLVILSV